ncbi:MAG TPA: type II secretion system protein [Pirellulales bacterium]|jgi:prepilin-type N-terminal cleavage/methylation domain-containing protein|nr:type II secretion system protein [Pirellulales bacterium]
MYAKRSSGFTLIEIMIVVVILAVLAATIVPQFSTSISDSKVSAMQTNLQSLRNQIQLYALEHNSTYPTITSGSLPQLTSTTNAAGTVGTGTSYPYGPYVQTQIPINPVDGNSTVTATTVFPPTAQTGAGGWLYDVTTGQIAPNDTAYLNY